MTKKVYKKTERAPSHAGEILKSGFIDQYDLSILTVSDLLGITREHLSRIINGHTPVTPDIASKLEILTKTPASQWLSIQAKYDTYIMQQSAEFKKYKQTLESWISGSLPLSPSIRRADKKTLALVARAAELAKHLGRKRKLA
jgi:antitoxin HigA-1